MRTNRTVACTALVVLIALTPLIASAQDVRSSDVESALVPGHTVWVTDSTGREVKTRIVGVSVGTVTMASDGAIRRLRTSEVTRVRARSSDSLLNGALIGAGAAVATGLFLCSLTEPWENCRDDVGPMLRIGAVGAAIGIGIDALIRGRKTIYEGAQGTRLHATPIVTANRAGVRLGVEF